jgi:hypothetical protein
VYGRERFEAEARWHSQSDAAIAMDPVVIQVVVQKNPVST